MKHDDIQRLLNILKPCAGDDVAAYRAKLEAWQEGDPDPVEEPE